MTLYIFLPQQKKSCQEKNKEKSDIREPVLFYKMKSYIVNGV